MYLNIKIHTTKAVLLVAFFFFSFSPAFAQYELKLDWQKKMSNGYLIASLTKSDNDSLIYISCGVVNDGPFEIRTIKTSDGSVVKSDTVDRYYDLFMSSDGKSVVASSIPTSNIALLDPEKFSRLQSVKVPNLYGMSYNEVCNKLVTYSDSIHIYDAKTLSLVKKFNFGVSQANITNDEKYVAYSYYKTYQKQDGTEGVINYLRIIDMEGNVIKKIDSVSSKKFALTHDGKTLIYFQPEGVHLINLETMQDELGIPHTAIGDEFNPQGMTVSNDDKFLMTATQLYDLKDNKRYTVLDQSDFANMCFDSQSNSLYCAGSNLYKYNLLPTSSVINSQNGIEYTLQVSSNNLVLKSTHEIRPDLQFGIAGVDGRFQKNILQNEIQIVSDGFGFDITNLNSGSYFLRIADSQNTLAVLKFLKVN